MHFAYIFCQLWSRYNVDVHTYVSVRVCMHVSDVFHFILYVPSIEVNDICIRKLCVHNVVNCIYMYFINCVTAQTRCTYVCFTC